MARRTWLNTSRRQTESQAKVALVRRSERYVACGMVEQNQALFASSRIRFKLCLTPNAFACTGACCVKDPKASSKSLKLSVPRQFNE